VAILDAGLLFLQDEMGRAEVERTRAAEKFGMQYFDLIRHTEAERRVSLLLQFDGDLSEALAIGFAPSTIAGDVAAGTIRVSALEQLEQLESVGFAEASRPMHSELDVSVPLIGVSVRHAATPPNRGAGVIVGVIDTGIDFEHECFRDSAGGSRILAIWDQNATPLATENHPNGFNFGVEYKKSDIDAAIAGMRTIQHRDSDGHGTHVAGIAAGNGLVAGNGQPASTFVGVAPDADIVVVAGRAGEAVGDSTATLDAVSYLLRTAEDLGKPIVINISLGDNLGPHDGTSLLERAIDNYLGKPGRAVVKSAGNARAHDIHAAGRIASAGTTVDVAFEVPAIDSTPDILDIWYSGSDDFLVAVIPPTGAGTALLSLGKHPMTQLPNGNAVKVVSFGRDPFNGDRRITVTIAPGTQFTLEPGIWTLRLQGVTVVDGSFHAWIQRDDRSMPKFVGPLVDPRFTITIPGTASKVVTVGAFVCKAGGTGTMSDLAPFSSIGPTRDHRQKPELTAPGEVITSVRRGSAGTPNRYRSDRGTSMAAPHVTGAMALLLEHNPTLTCTELEAALTCATDAFTGTPQPTPEWGRGKLFL
jgi:subtilisin family serine protease